MRKTALIAALMGLAVAAPAVAQTTQGQSTQGQSGTSAAAPAPAAPPSPRADCTFDTASLCKADGCSATEQLGDLPLPARVLVDQATNVLATVAPSGLPHVTPIGGQGTSAAGTVVLQGIDGTASWMLHASPSDTVTSLVISSNHSVLVAFGTCTPLD